MAKKTPSIWAMVLNGPLTPGGAGRRRPGRVRLGGGGGGGGLLYRLCPCFYEAAGRVKSLLSPSI